MNPERDSTYAELDEDLAMEEECAEREYSAYLEEMAEEYSLVVADYDDGNWEAVA